MNRQHATYKVVPYPKYRRWMVAALRSTHRTPMIHGLLEVDVTQSRAFLREQKARTGEALSFTAFLIACLAKAVDEHKAVQAFHQGSKHLVVFKEVDVLTDMEREVAGQKYVIPTILRAANHKSVRELHEELRAASRAEVPAAQKQFRPLLLPPFLYRPFFWAVGWIGRKHPRLWKTMVGTVEISAVGMFGKRAGWGLPPPAPTLMVTVGGIGEKPGIVDGHLVIREYLSLTISFDHTIVDGAPAARFTQRFKELIESAYGLDSPAAELEPIGEGVPSMQQVKVTRPALL